MDVGVGVVLGGGEWNGVGGRACSHVLVVSVVGCVVCVVCCLCVLSGPLLVDTAAVAVCGRLGVEVVVLNLPRLYVG